MWGEEEINQERASGKRKVELQEGERVRCKRSPAICNEGEGTPRSRCLSKRGGLKVSVAKKVNR